MERRYGGGVDAWLAERIKEATEAVTAERDALAAILAEVPHADNCPHGHWFIDEEAGPGGRTKQSFDCDCWKSKLPADALAARDADKWDEGREAESEAHFRDAGYGDVQHPVNPYRIEREAQ